MLSVLSVAISWFACFLNYTILLLEYEFFYMLAAARHHTASFRYTLSNLLPRTHARVLVTLCQVQLSARFSHCLFPVPSDRGCFAILQSAQVNLCLSYVWAVSTSELAGSRVTQVGMVLLRSAGYQETPEAQSRLPVRRTLLHRDHS